MSAFDGQYVIAVAAPPRFWLESALEELLQQLCGMYCRNCAACAAGIVQPVLLTKMPGELKVLLRAGQ